METNIPYQNRLLFEKIDLDEKLEKLYVFTNSEKYNTLDKDEQLRLQKQMIAMYNYSVVLGERLDALGLDQYESNLD